MTILTRLLNLLRPKNIMDGSILDSDNVLALFEHSTEFFCIFDLEMNYVFVNKAQKKLFGGKDLTGQNLYKIVPDIKTPAHFEILNRVLKLGETVVFENHKFVIEGKDLYVNSTYLPRRNPEGKITGMIILGSDVTDKVESSRLLEKNESQLRLITNKLPAWVGYTDTEGRYQFVNQKYADWLNIPESDFIGKKREEIAPKEYWNQSLPYEKEALAGKATRYESSFLNENGEMVYLDVNLVPDFDPETKKVRGLVAVAVDITERIKALKEAELAKKELQEVFQQSPAPMCLLSGPDHIFTLANPLYLQFVNREVLGKSLKEVFPEDRTYYEKIIGEVYHNGQPHFAKEAPVELFNSTGVLEKKFIDVGFHPYKDISGVTKGVLIIINDVTTQVTSRSEIENLAEELKASIASRDTFFGIASHELKTPLTAMKLQMQLQLKVLTSEGLDSFDKEAMETIFTKTISQADKLTRLVDDMLDISRITAEKLNMEFKEQNFSKLVRETFESYQNQLNLHDMHSQLDIREEFIFSFDYVRMEQVLTNLLNNSIKYAPHAPLQVKLYSEENVILLSIKDHGPGIPISKQQKIFERFETGPNLNFSQSGLGLGLFISRKIIEQHGGAITVESYPGEGSEFTIILPLP